MSAKLGWPVQALRWMLRVSAALGLFLLAGALWLAVFESTPPPEVPDRPPDLPDMRPIAIVALTVVGVPWTVYAMLGLAALRKASRALALLFLAFAVALPTVVLVVQLTDGAEDASGAEMNWLVIALPIWCGAICLLASTRSALATMGLPPRPWAGLVRGVTVAGVAGYFGWVVACGGLGNARTQAALAALHEGMTWREVVTSAAQVCPMARAEVMAGVMWLRCPPTAPPACRCAPALATSLELHFDEGKLASWRRRPQIARFVQP